MATLPIPYDVLDSVFAFLDRRALASACLVNKLFNFAATRALYGKEITLNPWTSKVSSLIQTHTDPSSNTELDESGRSPQNMHL